MCHSWSLFNYKSDLISVSALSETNDVNTGLLIEVWSKGMLWDNALGYHWIPLPAVKYSTQVGNSLQILWHGMASH
jgi:hypothetical protein